MKIAIDMPDNATNGEVLQKVFGCDHSFNIYREAEIAVGLDGNTEFTISWWNAPYKAESEENDVW